MAPEQRPGTDLPKARKAVEARDRAVRDLLDAIADERAGVGRALGPARSVAAAMLDRQEALARAELAWLRTFRSSIGKIGR